MQDALNEFVQQHPEYQQDNLHERFREDHHEIVFTPPYTPALQPTELFYLVEAELNILVGWRKTVFLADEHFARRPLQRRRYVLAGHLMHIKELGGVDWVVARHRNTRHEEERRVMR